MPKQSLKRMDDDDLSVILKAHIEDSIGSIIGSDGEIHEERLKAYDYYYGRPLGNEVKGRSQVIDRVVQDTIEWMMPSILEIFTASGNVVEFVPVGVEDEDGARQATDYVNHVFLKDNDGFQILFDMIKDALLLKTGVSKTYWDESDEVKRETYTSLSQPELMELLDDDDVEVAEQEEGVADVPDPATGQMMSIPVWDVTILRTKTVGRTVIETVPPEEFLFSRRAVRLEDERGKMKIPFVGHRRKLPVSDLIEMGFTWEEVGEIPSYDEGDYQEERVTRWQDQLPFSGIEMDPAMREVWIYECYMRVDADGDGVGELRKFLVAGAGYKILSHEPVDEQPFSLITPIPMPHKLIGESIADLTFDLQEINSTLWRQTLDNMYNVNNAREAYSNKVDIDDLLENKVGGKVSVDTDAGDVGGHILPMVTPPIIQQALPLIEFADQRRENRTGVSRYNQGLDPNSLNDTASGINMLQSASMRRVQLIARIFANTGIRDMFRKILRLEVRNRDEERYIRLRNEFVPMDPSVWNAQMDVTVKVGLGYGSKEQQMGAAMALMNVQKEMVVFQGGTQGPLVYPDHIQNAAAKFIESAGLGDYEPYLAEVEAEMGEDGKRPPPEPKQDPEMAKIQQEGQLKQAEMQMTGQMKQQEGQAKAQESQQRMQLEQWKAQQQIQLEYAKADAQIKLEQAKAKAQLELDAQKMGQEARFKMEEIGIKRDVEAMKLTNDVNSQRAKEGKGPMATEDLKLPSIVREVEKQPKPDVVNFQIPPELMAALTGNKNINIKRGSDGQIVGAEVKTEGGPSKSIAMKRGADGKIKSAEVSSG